MPQSSTRACLTAAMGAFEAPTLLPVPALIIRLNSTLGIMRAGMPVRFAIRTGKEDGAIASLAADERIGHCQTKCTSW